MGLVNVCGIVHIYDQRLSLEIMSGEGASGL